MNAGESKFPHNEERLSLRVNITPSNIHPGPTEPFQCSAVSRRSRDDPKARYRVCTTIRKNGERLVTVRCGRHVESLSAIFLTTRLRRLSASFNTVRTPAIAIAGLMMFCLENGISLFDRIVRGRFLLDQEWNLFLSLLSRTGNSATVARRGKDVLRFLRFWARWWAETIEDDVAHDAYLARAGLKLQTLRDDLSPAGNAESDRDEVPPEAVKLLVRVLNDEIALARLWPTQWVRIRNAFLLLLFLLLGNRAGEALGIRLSDLDLDEAKPTLSIVRRQDDPDDPRRRQPSVKGNSRKIGIPPGLMSDLASWLAIRPHACSRTDFLLVGRSGKPLTASSVAKIFRRLGKCFPELAGYSPHSFRHTFVATARRVRDRDGDPQADATYALARQVGWEDEASEAFYGHAQRAASADALLLRVQEELLDLGLPPRPAAKKGSMEHPGRGQPGNGDEPYRSRRDGPDRRAS